jgi:site-specific recombinase XerD
MRDFLSFLAPPLRDYLELKTSLGFTSFAHDPRADDLDHYLTFSQIGSFDQLNEDLVLRWLDARRHRSAGTKNQLLIFARGFFDYLLRHGHLVDNPARRIRSLKENPAKPYIYTLQEIHQILEAARKRPVNTRSPLLNRTLETLIFLLYACGLRLGEALKLKIKDVDLAGNTLSLWKTKFHKERLAPFSPAVAQKLKDYLAIRAKLFVTPNTEAPFFCHAGRKFSGHTIDAHFRQILLNLGLAKPKKGPRLHDMRHSFAVHRLYKWYQEGCDIQNKLPLLSTYMGHVSILHTQVYLTITTALLREADRRFQAGFEDLAKKPIGRLFKRR